MRRSHFAAFLAVLALAGTAWATFHTAPIKAVYPGPLYAVELENGTVLGITPEQWELLRDKIGWTLWADDANDDGDLADPGDDLAVW